MGFKKLDGSTWQPITPKKLKGTPYTGTLPAVLTGTKAGYLHRYKIYGSTRQEGTPTPENPIVPSECGERTENLFDVQDFTYTGEQSQQRPLLWEGTLPAGTYTVSVMQESELTSSVRNTIIVNVNGVARYESSMENYHNSAGLHKMTFDVNDGDVVSIYYWAHTLSNPCTYSNAMLNTGSTALPYEPYGYKLPLTSGSTPVDIYIGDDTLSDEEYVDSGTGKIYRMISGTLTPVNPPIPFPQIPTSAGSTTISWAGEGLAPSEFDSIQEWVDIPTYTYTNGAWVADN